LSERSFEKPLPAGVHVILGDSAAGIFRRVFRAGDQLLIDRDVLSCGPTPVCQDIGSWVEMRTAFWSSVVPGSEPRPAATDFGLLRESERLREAKQITIWTATGGTEQLFVAHVLHRAQEWGIDATKIQLVQFETLPDRSDRVLGTGQLKEQHLSEHPEPAALSAAALRDYRAAWTALTSPDPVLIEQFRESHPGANEWLKRAIRLLLRRFPDTRSGLPRSDFALLTHVHSHGPKAARAIAYTLGDFWDEADLVGDFYLFGRLLRLGDSRLPAPLLEISGDRASMRDVMVVLTQFGLDVLEGRASNYPTNPIDDWAAGVKLSSMEGLLWFNEGGHLSSGSRSR
jgi:hypothetical protein